MSAGCRSHWDDWWATSASSIRNRRRTPLRRYSRSENRSASCDRGPPRLPMQTLRLALRLVGRDWRAGELRVLMAAIFLAVASVGTVAFFADRVKAGLAQQANLLLGADVMISGDRPLPPLVRRRGAPPRPRDVAGDPLQQHGAGIRRWIGTGGADRREGRCRRLPAARRDRARGPGAPPSATTRTAFPARGEAWLDTRLADRLGVDQKAIEGRGWRCDADGRRRSSQQEPESRGPPFALGSQAAAEPRRRARDQPAAAGQSRDVSIARRRTQSRVTSSASARGSPARRHAGQRVESVRDLRPEVRQTLERAEHFLGLVGARSRAARRRRRRARGIAVPAAPSRRGGDVPLLRRVGRRER